LKLSRNKYLKSIGMYKIFSEHMEELRILFDGGDLGEACAIAMAKTLGCACLVTDDIKERGPYYTLMKTLDSEVIPFTFYEILFPD
jgi:predicted nucleic acid-binding protein